MGRGVQGDTALGTDPAVEIPILPLWFLMNSKNFVFSLALRT